MNRKDRRKSQGEGYRTFMDVKEERPPIWDQAKAVFGFNPETTVFTYGMTIYNPTGKPMPDHLYAHEEMHAIQQGGRDDGAEAWWGRYLHDPYFRIDQEAEAYARQWAYICLSITDRNEQNRILLDLAAQLASPTYGSVVNQAGAAQLIRQYATK